jgi:hypothetical protein
MAVIMDRWPLLLTTPALTDFTLKVYQIIEFAYRYIGESRVYDQHALDLLQMIILNLQGKGYFFWNTEDIVQPFSPPAEVLGDGDGLNYTCYLGHTAAALNRPPTGSDWTKYWYEGGESGGVWAVDSAYTSTGDFYPDTDTLSIENAYIRYQNSDYPPLDLISNYAYNAIDKKQQTGTPNRLYFQDKLTPRVFLYPQVQTSQVSDYVLVYKRMVRMTNNEGVSEIDDNFKSVWLLPLALLLAKELGLQKTGFSLEKLLLIEKRSDEALEKALAIRGTTTIVRNGSMAPARRSSIVSERNYR